MTFNCSLIGGITFNCNLVVVSMFKSPLLGGRHFFNLLLIRVDDKLVLIRIQTALEVNFEGRKHLRYRANSFRYLIGTVVSTRMGIHVAHSFLLK